jgi:hypothetical protein
MNHRTLMLAILAVGAAAAPLAAKDSLGIFSDWGAFRDPSIPRCYAIAIAEPEKGARDYQPYAAVGTWPKRAIRNQLHIRLSHKVAAKSGIRLVVGARRFELTGGGGDAWAKDKTMDAAITSAMRSATSMSVSSRDTAGHLFTDEYKLDGAATAMDAATVGCARLG